MQDPIILVLEPAQHAAIRAALCLYIQKGMGEPDRRPDNIHEIATGLDNDAPGEVISLDQESLEAFAKTIHTGAAAEAVLASVGVTGRASAACYLETGAALAMEVVGRWSSGDLAGAVNALEEWAGDVMTDFPGLDYEGDEEGEDDLSGGDPGYALVKSGGPVILTLEAADGVIEQKAAFATISDAESYLNTSTTIDPVDLADGRYGIDAPHGAGSDLDALSIAKALGLDTSSAAAALLALSKVEP